MTAKPTSESLLYLIDQGFSDAACGRRFGVSKYAIRRLRRRWDIAARRPLSRHRDELDPKADRWGQGDLDQSRIAALYGPHLYGPAAVLMCRPPGHLPGSSLMSSRPKSRAVDICGTSLAENGG